MKKSKKSNTGTETTKETKETKITKVSRKALKKQADADIAEIRKGLVKDEYAYLDNDSDLVSETGSELPTNGHDEDYDMYGDWDEEDA